MLDLPKDLDEAAQYRWGDREPDLLEVILPLCRPIIVSCVILHVLFAWNEYLFAMVFTSGTDMQTLPVGLTSIMAKHGTNYAVVFAAMTISALPIVIVFFAAQRYFIRGLSEGIGNSPSQGILHAQLAFSQLIGANFSLSALPVHAGRGGDARAGLTEIEMWGVAPHLDLFHTTAARVGVRPPCPRRQRPAHLVLHARAGPLSHQHRLGRCGLSPGQHRPVLPRRRHLRHAGRRPSLSHPGAGL